MPLSDELLTDMLGLVDRLTIRHKSTFTMHSDDGDRTITVTNEPLLKQLRKAVSSSRGYAGVPGGLASERNVIDSDALEYYAQITRKIKQLYGEVTDAYPFTSPEHTLRQWYIRFSDRARKGKVSKDVVFSRRRILAQMITAIESKLNPADVLEITSPCPRCEATYGQDERGIYRHAIIVESRIHEFRSLENTKAKCVACGATWIHGQGMRQLRYEIDQKNLGNSENIENLFDSYAIVDSATDKSARNSEGALP